MSPFAIFLLVVGLVLFLIGSWYFSADQRAKRAMRAVALSSIEEVRDGERARVVGHVEVDEPIYAPLSGRPCAYWRVVVEERVGGGKNRSWKRIVDEHAGIDFLLRDPTGLAYVETLHVDAVLDRDAEGGAGMLRDPSPELGAFLGELGHDTKGLFFNRTLRYREGVAGVDEEVAVVAEARWERDPDASARAGAGYREASLPKRLRLVAPEDGTPLRLSDQTDVMG